MKTRQALKILKREMQDIAKGKKTFTLILFRNPSWTKAMTVALRFYKRVYKEDKGIIYMGGVLRGFFEEKKYDGRIKL